MKDLQQNTLVTYVDAVPDPCCEGMCLRNFLDILIIAICAVLCGVKTAKLGRKKKAGCLLQSLLSEVGFKPPSSGCCKEQWSEVLKENQKLILARCDARR